MLIVFGGGFGGGRFGRGGRGRGGRGRGGRGHDESLEQEVTRLAQKRINRDEWFSIPRWKQEKIKSKRKELKAEKESQASLTSTLASRISELESRISLPPHPGTVAAPAPPPNPPPNTINTQNNNDDPSQLTNSGASMFGRNAHPRVGAVYTSKRTNYIFDLKSVLPSVPTQVEGRLELDSHADTTCAGPEVRILDYTGQVCTVHGFSDSLSKMENVPIVNGITSYIHPESGETFVLVLNNALYMGSKLEHSLLCPNQSRSHGVIVDDVPIHLGPNATHSINFPNEGLTIPLKLRGCLLYLDCHYTTDQEMEECTWVDLTGPGNWDPYSDEFEREELRTIALKAGRAIHSMNTINKADYECDPETSKILEVYATKTTGKKSDIKPESLSKLWGIPLDTAQKTIEATTQQGLKSGIYPLVRRFRTKQAHLRYNQLGSLHGTFYTDTFFASITSQRGFKCGQMFCNAAGFMYFVPMVKESDAHHALTDFVKNVGIPSTLVSDNAGAETKARFKNKTTEYGIPVRTTEPYSPW